MPLLVVCFSCQREGESQAAGLPGETVPVRPLEDDEVDRAEVEA